MSLETTNLVKAISYPLGEVRNSFDREPYRSANLMAATTNEPLQQRLSLAAAELRDALNAVIEELPIATIRPAEFCRVLKVDRTLSSRLIRAVRMADPLATLHRMPGPQGIRRVLAAATTIAIDPMLILRAEKVLGDLEVLVSREIGTWQDLGAALAGWLPEAREEFDLGNRQVAYRAMTNLKGKSTELLLMLRVAQFTPGEPAYLDTATIFGLVRFKRIRDGVPITFTRNKSTLERLTSIEGINQASPSPVLEEFCSKPTPGFTICNNDNNETHFELTSDEIGISSLADIYITDILRSPQDGSDYPHDHYILSSSVNMPARAMIFDAIIHDNLVENLEPEPQVFDTGVRGTANPRNPSSRSQRIETVGQIQRFGKRINELRIGEIERYSEMIDYVFDELGWDRSKFQAYRWRVEFPLVASQYSMVFSKQRLKAD